MIEFLCAVWLICFGVVVVGLPVLVVVIISPMALAEAFRQGVCYAVLWAVIVHLVATILLKISGVL